MGQNIGKNIEHLEHILTKQKQNDVFFQPEVIYVIWGLFSTTHETGPVCQWETKEMRKRFSSFQLRVVAGIAAAIL